MNKQKKQEDCVLDNSYHTKSDESMTTRIVGQAIVRYYERHCVAYVDPQLAAYWRRLAPKYLYLQPPKYPPHITIVRLGLETVPNTKVWGKYEGRVVKFSYKPRIYKDGDYYYLKVYSSDICDIRRELWLPKYRAKFTGYHITISNTKWKDKQ